LQSDENEKQAWKSYCIGRLYRLDFRKRQNTAKEELMIRTLFIAGILFFLLSGCAAKAPQEEQAAVVSVVEIVKEEKPEKVEVPEKDPCEVLLDEIILKSRETMKTVKDSCQDLRIEVNPMWSMDYDGTVHIRIYDAAGNKIRDELQKPE
jgi:hypothetical protein